MFPCYLHHLYGALQQNVEKNINTLEITELINTANPRITRLIRSEKSSRNAKTRKVNN